MVPPSGAVLLKNKMPQKSTLEDYVFSRPAPRDENLEMALLGAMMLDRDAYFLVRDIAGPETMYSTANRLVYEAIDRCEHDGLPIDLLTVADRHISRTCWGRWIITSSQTGPRYESCRKCTSSRTTRPRSCSSRDRP